MIGDKLLKEKPLSQRDLESMERKEQIYKTALELYSKYGYKDTTIKNISEESGISIGSIYHHYKNKEAILLELCEHMGDAESFVDDLDEKAKDPYKPLYRFIIAYFGDWEALGVNLTKTIYQTFDIAYLYVDNTYKKPNGFRKCEQFFALAQQKGTLDSTISAEDAIHLLLIFCRGILFEWMLYNGTFALTQRAEAYLPRVLGTFIV
jgi:AcrR family transcriptional regulator